MRIAAILDLVEQVMLAMIVRLVGLASPYRSSRMHIVILQYLHVGHFLYWASLLYRGMLSQLTRVHHGTLHIFFMRVSNVELCMRGWLCCG